MENARFEPLSDILNEELFLPFGLSIRELLNQLHFLNLDGGPGSGRKPENGGENKGKPLNNSENSGTIYAEEQIVRYLNNPKELGDTTHREKYDDFKSHGVNVKPLGDGGLKGRPYEEGGGYRVNGSQDGQYMQYHPEEKTHHGEEYYKLCSGKTGKKRYNMSGDLKVD